MTHSPPMVCDPTIERDRNATWGVSCTCGWVGVFPLDSRRTADQAAQQHLRQRAARRQKVMER